MSLEHLPADLVPTLLPFLLPPIVPLPPHLLSPLFRQRLIYLEPSLSQMDRQLSPFPLPITSDALQQRLESLAGGYEVGPVKYAYDGESGIAKRAVLKEGGGEEEWQENSEAVEMHFTHDNEEGWGFHGLRIPGKEAEMGLDWVDDPRELDIPLAEGNDMSASVSTLRDESRGNEISGYGGQDEDDAEVKDYWAGFSPPQSPTIGASGNGPNGAMIDEEEREREYWAQYSNGPSKAASPAISRRQSEMADHDGSTSNRNRSGTLMPLSSSSQHEPSSPSTTKIPGVPGGISVPAPTATPPSDVQPQSQPLQLSSPPKSSNTQTDITLLRSRLRMKTLSILRREWTTFSGDGGQDELEEKGMRWLSIGREVTTGQKGGLGVGRGEEEKLRCTMETLREMHDVYADQNDEEGGNGFYRLVEQALAQDGTGEAGGEAGNIPRNYSFDQATYWE